MVWLLSRDRRSLDILSIKKEAKLSASEIPGVEEGKDVYHTLTHGVALVRILNAGLKGAARGSLQM